MGCEADERQRRGGGDRGEEEDRHGAEEVKLTAESRMRNREAERETLEMTGAGTQETGGETGREMEGETERGGRAVRGGSKGPDPGRG